MRKSNVPIGALSIDTFLVALSVNRSNLSRHKTFLLTSFLSTSVNLVQAWIRVFRIITSIQHIRGLCDSTFV